MPAAFPTPSAGLLVKLATIAQLVDEATQDAPIKMDKARNLLADRDVSHFLDSMHREGLLPQQVMS
jgi:hypothetical protein